MVFFDRCRKKETIVRHSEMPLKGVRREAKKISPEKAVLASASRFAKAREAFLEDRERRLR